MPITRLALIKLVLTIAVVLICVWHQLEQTATAQPDGARDAVPDGFSETRLVAIQVMMTEAVSEGRIPSGIAMLARDDQILWLETAGEMGPGIPMREDAILPLASVGKMYTAVAAMILMERGDIALDDPVSRYIPEFADLAPETPLTLFHLLTHTGGLTVSGDAFWTAWNTHSDRTTTTHLARALAALPLVSEPGERFDYGPTGASYEVLGAVIEIASGQTLEAFMVENIFEPLGLDDTYFYVPEEKSDRLPAFYRKVDDELQLVRAQGVDFPRSTFFHGGGGVASSPRDIVRFTQVFLNDGSVGGVRVLRPETVELMMTNHVGDKAPYGGGLGWGFGASVLAAEDGTTVQYGWIGGGYAILWIAPQESLTAYFAFPVEPPGDSGLINQFRGLVAAEI